MKKLEQNPTGEDNDKNDVITSFYNDKANMATVERSAAETIPSKPKKNLGGRPPLFTDPKDLQERVDAYFDSCWVDKVRETMDKDGGCTMSTVRYQDRPYTIMGLALTLGMCRDTLCEYAKYGQFSDVVKKAKQKVEM